MTDSAVQDAVQAVNVTMAANEATLAAMFTALTGAVGRRVCGTTAATTFYLIPGKEWRGVAATDLDDNANLLHFPTSATSGWIAPNQRIRLPMVAVHTASPTNIVYAIPGVNLGYLPLTYRIAYADGKILYS